MPFEYQPRMGNKNDTNTNEGSPIYPERGVKIEDIIPDCLSIQLRNVNLDIND
jgi:hypothetical protein